MNLNNVNNSLNPNFNYKYWQDIIKFDENNSDLISKADGTINSYYIRQEYKIIKYMTTGEVEYFNDFISARENLYNTLGIDIIYPEGYDLEYNQALSTLNFESISQISIEQNKIQEEVLEIINTPENIQENNSELLEYLPGIGGGVGVIILLGFIIKKGKKIVLKLRKEIEEKKKREKFEAENSKRRKKEKNKKDKTTKIEDTTTPLEEVIPPKPQHKRLFPDLKIYEKGLKDFEKKVTSNKSEVEKEKNTETNKPKATVHSINQGKKEESKPSIDYLTYKPGEKITIRKRLERVGSPERNFGNFRGVIQENKDSDRYIVLKINGKNEKFNELDWYIEQRGWKTPNNNETINVYPKGSTVEVKLINGTTRIGIYEHEVDGEYVKLSSLIIGDPYFGKKTEDIIPYINIKEVNLMKINTQGKKYYGFA